MADISKILQNNTRGHHLKDVVKFILDNSEIILSWNNNEQYEFYFYRNDDECKAITIAKWDNKFWYYFDGHQLNKLTELYMLLCNSKINLLTLQNNNEVLMMAEYTLKYVSASITDEYTGWRFKFSILKPYCTETQNIYISYIPFSESIIADLKLDGYVNIYTYKNKEEVYQWYHNIGFTPSEMDDRYVYICTIKQNEDYL